VRNVSLQNRIKARSAQALRNFIKRKGRRRK